MKIVTFKSVGSIEQSAPTLDSLRAQISCAIQKRADSLHSGDIFEVLDNKLDDGRRVLATDHLGTYVFDPIQHEEPRFCVTLATSACGW